MRLTNLKTYVLALLALLLAGCGYFPHQTAETQKPEKLIVHPDGSMEFRDRYLDEEDVIIYEDGYGGEKAAVRIRMAPLHPDFFRDTIVVERRGATEPEELTQN